jgi:hypothetical protein
MTLLARFGKQFVALRLQTAALLALECQQSYQWKLYILKINVPD